QTPPLPRWSASPRREQPDAERGRCVWSCRECYLRLCMYATSPSRSAAGRFAHFFGIGGFLLELVLAAIATGSTIHARMSSAESFAPTPSSGLALPPLPAIAWQTEHFWAAYTCWPLAASCDRATPGTPAMSAAAMAATNRRWVVVLVCMVSSPCGDDHQ